MTLDEAIRLLTEWRDEQMAKAMVNPTPYDLGRCDGIINTYYHALGLLKQVDTP